MIVIVTTKFIFENVIQGKDDNFTSAPQNFLMIKSNNLKVSNQSKLVYHIYSVSELNHSMLLFN